MTQTSRKANLPRHVPTHAYTVRHHAEEGPCDACGSPIYVGDPAYGTAARTYCSQGCADRDAAKTAR